MNLEIDRKAVAYVAFGDLYLAQALLSVKTLRKFDKSTKIVLITNIEFDQNLIPYWRPDIDKLLIFNDSSNQNRHYKTNIFEYVEAEKIAYIDSDTIILSKFDIAWSFLDYFDICFKFNPVRQKKPGKGDIKILESKYKISELPHFNGGLFFFKKCDATKEFFNIWNQTFKKYKNIYDQVSLNESLFKSKVRILPLTAEWNYFPDINFYKGKVRNPIILHYTNRISYLLEDELMKIANLINLDKTSIKQKIIKRRSERRQKIGRSGWFKLCLLWFLFYKSEKKRLNLN